MALLRPGLKVLYTSGYTADAILRHGVMDSSVALFEKPFGRGSQFVSATRQLGLYWMALNTPRAAR